MCFVVQCVTISFAIKHHAICNVTSCTIQEHILRLTTQRTEASGVPMVGQRRRRWTNIETILVKRLEFFRGKLQYARGNNTSCAINVSPWIKAIDHSMYVSGFSCTPVVSISVISAVLSGYRCVPLFVNSDYSFKLIRRWRIVQNVTYLFLNYTLSSWSDFHIFLQALCSSHFGNDPNISHKFS